MRFLGRLLGFLFAIGAILFVIGAGIAGLVVWHYQKDLPDYTQLKNYEPPVMTRVHAGDGSVLAEYKREFRIFLPISAIPDRLKQAFISAEDKHFYTHNGIDPEGIVRALLVMFQGGQRLQGASTITQQVAKNFLVGSERNFERKIREVLVSFRIESAYSKDKILELYLNEIYLGLGNYGVAAAALNYFGKSVNELTIGEMAYIAGLAKGPSNYHPFRAREAAIDRRNYVIARMVADHYITQEEGDKAKAEPLGVNPRVLSPNSYAAGYFAEDIRRELMDRYGEQTLYEGGLSVRATLNPHMQRWARKALTDGLVRYDEAHGFRGPLRTMDIKGDWGLALAEVPVLADVAPWRLAVVLEQIDQTYRIGLQPQREKSGEIAQERLMGVLPAEGVKWARLSNRTPLRPGDVIYVEPIEGRPNQYRLRQIPEISGAVVAMDPHTGRVFAMVGGFSFSQSEFNRASQAMRQPGSAFKPFVYAAALDNGYTPTSLILDDPIAIDMGNGNVWRPDNFEKNGAGGAHTLRFGVEHSHNLMTVRLARDVGMPLIVEYAKRFRLYDDMPPLLSLSLGAGETTVLRMVTAYSMLANGGKRITPTLIDRIQDRWGHTIYRHDERVCLKCDSPTFKEGEEPKLIDKTEQIIDPLTAYQITSIMEGVILRGTGQSIRELNRHLAGKTGTTNEAKDLWFVGFSPDLAFGVYLGFDRPRSMGDSTQAAQWAAPIFREFMRQALKDTPDVPFRVPAGIKFISVDLKTGIRASGPGTILEAFKPGTGPSDTYSVPVESGMELTGDAPPAGVTDVDRALGSGTGGLY